MTNATFSQLVSMLNAHPARDTADIGYCFKPRSIHHFSEQTMLYGEKMGFDWVTMFSPEQKQKQIKRATQFINNLHAGISQGWDKTHVRVLSALIEGDKAGFALPTDAIHSIASNKIVKDVETRGLMGRVNEVCGKVAHGKKTVSSKTSNSVGANGFMTVQNMTASTRTHNNEVFLNNEHNAVKRFAEMWGKFTQDQKNAALGIDTK